MKRIPIGFIVAIAVLINVATAQKPVDTHQFGLIQLRMHKDEVQKRLGPPEKIMYDPHHEIPDLLELMGGRYVTCHYAYYYPSTFRIPPTVICFAGKYVSGKWRLQR